MAEILVRFSTSLKADSQNPLGSWPTEVGAPPTRSSHAFSPSKDKPPNPLALADCPNLIPNEDAASGYGSGDVASCSSCTESPQSGLPQLRLPSLSSSLRQNSCPVSPSFFYDDDDPHIYRYMTMADFSIGDGEEEEESRQPPDESEETQMVQHHKRATVREAHEMFATVFGSTPLSDLRASAAPGRVNLIGEHVDYCDGFVLPMAIPLYTAVVGRLAEDQSREYTDVHSVHFNETVRIRRPYSEGVQQYPQWARYVQGVLALYEPTPCLDLLVHSHIPPGSSLSSSAALELSVLYAVMEFVPESDRLSVKDAALLCQKAEHAYAGVPCGIMDQLVIAAAQNQKALKIDCLTLEMEAIPMSIAHDVVFLVTNSGVKHALATSEYAKRRLDVDRAVKLIGANSWRDVNEELLRQRSASLTGEGGDMLERATHVVEEIARTVEAANALLDNNILLFGKLMTASHESLRRKYSVSCAELDELVKIALSVEGVFGARMTGGGFGGCTVTMVRRDAVDTLKAEIKERYRGGQATFLECEPVGGVRPICLDFLILHKSQ